MRFLYFKNNGKSYCLNADKIHRVKSSGCSIKIYLIGKFFPIKLKATSEKVAIDFVDEIHTQLRGI